MIEAFRRNGWLRDLDAVLIGYLPSRGHVDTAVNLLSMMPDALPVVVDPVLGDDPTGLYIDADAAAAVRDLLVPRADVLTPNLFELGWLTGCPVAGPAEAVAAARCIEGPRRIHVTSAPFGHDQTGVISLLPAPEVYRVPRQADVPHGVGDVFSALIATGLSAGQALGHLQALIGKSLGAEHLDIIGSARVWAVAPAISATDPELLEWLSTSS